MLITSIELCTFMTVFGDLDCVERLQPIGVFSYQVLVFSYQVPVLLGLDIGILVADVDMVVYAFKVTLALVFSGMLFNISKTLGSLYDDNLCWILHIYPNLSDLDLIFQANG